MELQLPRITERDITFQIGDQITGTGRRISVQWEGFWASEDIPDSCGRTPTLAMFEPALAKTVEALNQKFREAVEKLAAKRSEEEAHGEAQ